LTNFSWQNLFNPLVPKDGHARHETRSCLNAKPQVCEIEK